MKKLELRQIIKEEVQRLNEGKVSPSKVRSAVNKVKKQLIKKWKSKGGYENFGQKELRKLNDKFVNMSDYSYDMNKIRDILQQFNVWAMNYTGENESINERIDFRNVRRELEWEYPWDYVEEEGSGRIRFDWDRNKNSMWVNDDGSVEGGVPRDSGLKRKMKKLGIKESVNEATKINLNKFTKYIRSAIDSVGTKPDTTKIHAILLKLYPQASRKDLWNLARGIEDVGLSLGEGVIKDSINEGKSYSLKFASWFTGTVLNNVKHPKYGDHIVTPNQLKHSSSNYRNKLFKAIDKAVKRGDITPDMIKKHESINEGKKIPKKNTPDYHQYKIAVDHVKNPLKGKFLGGPTEKEAIEILKRKFGYSNKDIKKLQQ